MLLKIFSVYDSKLEAFTQPFFLATKGQAIRAFSDTIEDPQSQFCKHPADFTLFELGTYDDSLGIFDQLPTKINLGTALELKSRAANLKATDAQYAQTIL